MSYTAVRRIYGFQNMQNTQRCVLNAIDDTMALCEAIYDLSHTADLALLSSMGIEVPQQSVSESDSSAELDMDDTSELPTETERHHTL